MKVKFVSLLLAMICFTLARGELSEIKAQQYNHPDVEPQLITLLSQHKHRDFTKANFNFKLGVRGDSKSPRTWNNYDLRYGGNSLGGDSDYFDVSISKGSYTQIIDMGALNWTGIYDVPLLYARSESPNGLWIHDCSKCVNNSLDNVKVMPENALVKVVTGHMYLVRVQDINRDLYAMFRVESLKFEDEVTISWKVVPSPENNKP